MSKESNAEQLTRVFGYAGMELADPGTDKTPDEVKAFYAGLYAELNNADVKGPVTENNRLVYTFLPRLGNKG